MSAVPTRKPPGVLDNDDLCLVHLSDIHFHPVSGDYFDVDRSLRTEVELDLQSLLAATGRPLSGVLLTGDIAYAGRPEEYQVASDWLLRLHCLLEFPRSHVWVTPGNHDVDRSVVRSNQALAHLRRAVQESPNAEQATTTLADYLREAEVLFMRPLAEYNRFAAPFQCSMGDGRPPYWDNASLRLNDGSALHIRGLNSVLLSGPDDKCGNLLLGEFQLPDRRPGSVQLTLCHHPLPWLRDRDALSPRLDRAVALQLFGHIHEHQVDANDSRIRLVSGAVHPERSSPVWAPGYNYLALSIVEEGGRRCLRVTVFPRVWSKAEARFVSHTNSGAESATYYFPLEPLPQQPRAPEKPEPASLPPEPAPMPRNLAFDYLTLPYLTRVRIAQNLGLLDQDDERLPDNEKFRRVIERVRNRHLEEALRDQIAQNAPDRDARRLEDENG